MFSNTVVKISRSTMWLSSLRKMTSKSAIPEKVLDMKEKVAKMTPQELLKNNVKLSDWNKRLMVFAGRYKSMAEVPDILPFETVDRARNTVRVRVCNIMIVMTLIGCVVMVISGKKAAEAGISVSSLNRDWHREYNEQAKKEEESKG